MTFTANKKDFKDFDKFLAFFKKAFKKGKRREENLNPQDAFKQTINIIHSIAIQNEVDFAVEREEIGEIHKELKLDNYTIRWIDDLGKIKSFQILLGDTEVDLNHINEITLFWILVNAILELEELK
jgi:hypothetical protein